MYNIFTASRFDVYDYLRCPKIVALKTYRNIKKPIPQKKPAPSRSLKHEIGAIGELVTQKAFSGEDIIPEIPTSEDRPSGLAKSDDYKAESALKLFIERRALPAIQVDPEEKGSPA